MFSGHFWRLSESLSRCSPATPAGARPDPCPCAGGGGGAGVCPGACAWCVADIQVTAELFVAVYRAGRADEAAERDAAEAAAWRVVAERVARCGPGHAELRRRREAAMAAVPARSAEEIRQRTAASWAAVEARITAGVAARGGRPGGDPPGASGTGARGRDGASRVVGASTGAGEAGRC